MIKDDTPSNLSAEIFAELKNRIIHWEYLPNHRFTEIALSEEFGVSRSPIREVLQMLEENGLVKKIPRLGYTVHQPDLSEIIELYDFRLALELFIVENLAEQGMDEEMWEELHDYWYQCLNCLPEIDKNITIRDEAYHEELAKSFGNFIFLEKLKEVNERIHFIRMNDITTPDRLELTCKQHLMILTAIKQRDVELARTTIMQNIQDGRLNVDQAIKEALSKKFFNNIEMS